MKALITTPRGFIFDTFFPKENIELAESLGEIVWNDTDRQFTKAEIIERINECDVYVTTWGAPRLDQEILDSAPNLKMLTHLCGTVAPVVSDAVWDRDIKVLSGNRFFAESVAEGTLAYILTVLRNIPFYSTRAKEGKIWKNPTDYNQGLAGKKIGIISYGAIARNLVRILSAFRVEMYVYDIVPLPDEDVKKYGLHQSSMEDIFSSCDIISVHTPLFEATRHLINASLISRIKEGALFVNTSRGAVVDQKALEEELKDGRFHAMLDVFEYEPPKPDSPLYRLPNVTIMPHMGGPTIDLRQIIARELLNETAMYLNNTDELQSEITKEMAAIMSLG